MVEPFTPEDSIDRAQHLMAVHAETLDRAVENSADAIDVLQLEALILKLQRTVRKIKDRNPAWPIPVLRGPMGRITHAPS